MTQSGPLTSLIGDMPVCDFLDAVWGREVAHYPAQVRVGAGAWLTLDAFEAALATLNRAHEGWLHLARQGLTALPASFVDAEGLLDMTRLATVLSAGQTLYLTKAERVFPPLAQLCAELACELGGHSVPLRNKISAHVFLTPPHSQGFAPHRDEHASFILQMEGAKEWTIHAPRTAADRDQLVQAGGVDPDTLRRHCPIDVRLEPGDVLYMPEWWPHEARSGNAHSLHVTLRVFPLRWSDLLQQIGARQASLAKAVPAAAARTPGSLAAELGRILAEPGFLDEIGTLPASNAGTWMRTGRFREVLRLHDLTYDTPLVRVAEFECQVRQEVETASLSYPGGAILGPCEFLPVFEFVARTDRLRPRELPSIAAQYDRLDVARRLVSGGVMRIDGDY